MTISAILRSGSGPFQPGSELRLSLSRSYAVRLPGLAVAAISYAIVSLVVRRRPCFAPISFEEKSLVMLIFLSLSSLLCLHAYCLPKSGAFIPTKSLQKV